MARGDNGLMCDINIRNVEPNIAERFENMCDRKHVDPARMFETMVRSFDRGSTVYSLDGRLDFGKYSGMNVEDAIRTDTRYVAWLVRESAWFKLDTTAERLLRQMEAG